MATLVDILTRHQIYLEGVKANQAREFNAVLLELQTELRKKFSSSRYETLDQYTKVELQRLIKALRDSQSRIYNGYTSLLLRMLREFMEADVEVSTSLFETSENKTLKQANEENDEDTLLGFLAASGTNKGNDRLWAAILNSPLPANGMLLLPFIKGFTNAAINAIENAIRKGQANRSTIADVLKSILGTKEANFRDGVLAGVLNQARAVIDTALQHVSTIAQNTIASVFHRKYVWVSVIDGRTTDICRSRNGNVYIYGKGPLPPAHIRCRSKVVPVTSKAGSVPSSYFAWLKAQPDEVLDDVLDARQASKVKSGKAKAEDFGSFAEPKPLTIAQFKAKLRLMLMDN